MQRSQSTSTHRFFLKKILRRSRREEKAQETRGMAEGQSTTSNRWNPTSEQIALLEATYSEGLRTPNPDQIEQIASRLRMYGNIEGKSVFYWFQNRKARERQRQKQERVPSINQFLQPPSLAGTSHRNTLLSEVLSREQKSAAVMPKINGTTDDNQTANAGNLSELPTLELFPLHPSGMARANPQSVQESRNVSRSNDSRSGGGHFQNFFHFIPRHPGN